MCVCESRRKQVGVCLVTQILLQQRQQKRWAPMIDGYFPVKITLSWRGLGCRIWRLFHASAAPSTQQSPAACRAHPSPLWLWLYRADGEGGGMGGCRPPPEAPPGWRKKLGEPGTGDIGIGDIGPPSGTTPKPTAGMAPGMPP